MSHFKSLVNSFNSLSSASPLGHIRQRSASRGMSLDEPRHRSTIALSSSTQGTNSPLNPQQPKKQTISVSPAQGNQGNQSRSGANSAGRSGGNSPCGQTQSSATSPTSGLGTTTQNTGNSVLSLRNKGHRQSGTAQVNYIDDAEADEEEQRELRRQRRLRRRSIEYPYGQQEDPSTPTGNDVDHGERGGGSYGYVESRFMNNGKPLSGQERDVVPPPPPLEERKGSSSCRRKRYQFLNFAPRATSKS